MATDGGAGERLQKVLANAGLGSRREIEEWIRAGRVQVDGRVAQLGERVLPQAQITVDGRRVAQRRLQAVERYLVMYNKPEGEIVTRDDPEGRPTVFERLPRLRSGRWISVGRLDVNSAGLLLFTTDGELANRLMHPGQLIEREYAVRVLGEVTDDMLQRLVQGVELEDGPARCEEITCSGGEGANRWFHLVIMEGRNREVRRLWDAVGARVNRLKRVRFGPVILDSSVKAGQWRELRAEERTALLQAAGMPDQRPWGSLATVRRSGVKKQSAKARPQVYGKPAERGRPGRNQWFRGKGGTAKRRPRRGD